MKCRTLTDCRRLFRRVLTGWKVRRSKKPSFPHVKIDHKKRQAVIFPYKIHLKVTDGHGVTKTKHDALGKTPKDYYLHEMMHVCMGAITEAKGNERWWLEEQFVRIVCDLAIGEKRRTSGTRPPRPKE